MAGWPSHPKRCLEPPRSQPPVRDQSRPTDRADSRVTQHVIDSSRSEDFEAEHRGNVLPRPSL